MLASTTIPSLAALLLAQLVSAANHTVIVGGAAGLKFQPETLDAEVGDFVTYIFQAANHTVTQSPFANPCKLLENATINAVGFDSGFVPVTKEATEFPAWTIEVTAKTPIWYFCAQGPHCKNGMVGAINAPKEGEKTFEAFKGLAMSGEGANPAPAPGGASVNTAVSFSPTQTGVGAAGRTTSSANAADVSAAAASAGSSTTGAASVGAQRTSLAAALVALVAASALLA